MKKIMIIIGFAMAMSFASDAVAQENSGNGEQGTAAVNVWCRIKTAASPRKGRVNFTSDVTSTTTGKVDIHGNGTWTFVQAPDIDGTVIISQSVYLYNKYPLNPESIYLARHYNHWKENVDFTESEPRIGTLHLYIEDQ